MDWLLPACAARLAGGGYIYAEAGGTLDAAAPLEVWRRAKAGQVHYHLLRRSVARGAAEASPCPRPSIRGPFTMIKVVYPGTFDPFTRGHEDLVRRAAQRVRSR